MQVCITFFQFSSLSWSKWVQKNRKKIAKKSWKIAKNHEFLRKKKREILYLFFPLQLSKLIKMSTKKVLKKLQKNREKSMNFHWNYMKIFIKNVWLFIKIFREFSWPKLAHRATTGAQDPRHCTFSKFFTLALRWHYVGITLGPGFGPVHIQRRPVTLTRPPSWGQANTLAQNPRNCSFLYFKSTANRRQIDGKSTAPGFGPVHIERRPARSTRSTPGAFYFRLQRRNPRGPAGGPLSYFCHFLSFHSFLRVKGTSKGCQRDVKRTSPFELKFEGSLTLAHPWANPGPGIALVLFWL